MTKTDIPLRLAPDMHALLAARARQEARPIAQVAARIVERELRRRQDAKTTDRSDERLVARLQRLLAPTIADAGGWQDLARDLATLGYEMRPAGGGITLHLRETGERLCKASELGFAYARLVRRFGAPMPGHPHRLAHLCGSARRGAPPRHDGRPEDRFDVIDPI
ncbi:MAG: hypothetical protein HLUCCA08_11240 [Rhodobacteraceae bacterium HLUCCA08]|nr:MAG: hypothetical protein HLUCCA08_11240 [Rhodobacteraceae bacterium HLUCCA08]